jgi:hypothetical protein
MIPDYPHKIFTDKRNSYSRPDLEKELKHLFAKHSESDKIRVFYDTNVYYKQY